MTIHQCSVPPINHRNVSTAARFTYLLTYLFINGLMGYVYSRHVGHKHRPRRL